MCISLASRFEDTRNVDDAMKKQGDDFMGHALSALCFRHLHVGALLSRTRCQDPDRLCVHGQGDSLVRQIQGFGWRVEGCR